MFAFHACLILSGLISDDMLCAGAPGKDACQANHYFLIFHIYLVQTLNPVLVARYVDHFDVLLTLQPANKRAESLVFPAMPQVKPISINDRASFWNVDL